MKGELDLHKQPLFGMKLAPGIPSDELYINCYGILYVQKFSVGIPKETLKYFAYKEEL